AHLLGILVGDLVVGIGDILGNVDNHGAGAAAGRHVEGLGDGLGNIFLALDHVAVLHDGTGNTDHVGFLEGVVTDLVAGNLAGDHHQGNGIHVGGGNAGDGIGGTGPGGDQHRPHLAGDAGIGIGGVDRGLLVAHQDMVDL